MSHSNVSSRIFLFFSVVVLFECFLLNHGFAQPIIEGSPAYFQEWLAKAKEGDPEAQQRVGTLYFSGLGVQQSYTSAVEWYRKAADQGQTAAAANLARCYQNGWGVAKDQAMAQAWSDRSNQLIPQATEGKAVSTAAKAPAPSFNHSSENLSFQTASRLVETIFPSINVQGASIDELFSYFEVKAKDIDPALSHLKIRYETTMMEAVDNDPRRAAVSLSLSYVPMIEMLKYVAALTQTKFKIHEDAVIFAPVSDRSAFHKYYSFNDWKQEAVRLFPDLRDSRNPMFNAVSNEVVLKTNTTPDFFKSPDWPLRLASAVGYKLHKFPDQSQHPTNPLEFSPPPLIPEDSQVGAKTSNPKNAQQIAKMAMASVFTIVVTDQNDKPLSLGSGFLVGKNLLATNVHVLAVPNAAKGYAIGVNNNVKIGLIGIESHNERADIAVVQLAVEPGQALELSDDKLPQIGEDVFVIGSPKGLSGTFSTGVVSALRESDGRDEIQISAPISSGSSGGPVLNSEGKVIGVSVATMKSGQNLNFAIPVKYLNALLGLR